nr:MAG TPA: hypothetical protein [Bacteriophage sp.]
MKYVLKVADCDSFVESFVVDPHYGDKFVHVFYTDKSEEALTFDDINEAIFHLVFIKANLSSTNFTEESIGIYEVQTFYKEI